MKMNDIASVKGYLTRKRVEAILSVCVILLLIGSVDAGGWTKGDTRNVICGLFKGIRSVALAIASVIMVLAGIKWVASGDDPGGRKAAKDVMVHVIIGLILILVVGYVLSQIASGASYIGQPCA